MRGGDSAYGGHGRALRAKNFLKRGWKTENWGVRGTGRWSEGTLYRVYEMVFGSRK